MRKYFFNVIVVVVFLMSCKSNSGSFIISGKIKGAQENKVYLQELSYNSADAKTIDSADIGKDGSYTLKGSSAQQNLFVISLKNDPEVILVNDEEKMNIDFDVNGFHYPEVSGSDATSELYNFIKNYRQKDSILAISYYELDTLKNETDTAYSNFLKQRYTKELNDLDDVIRNFVNNSKNPAAICFAFDKAKGSMAPDELSALAENASKRFPQHTGVTLFKTQLAQLANAAGYGTYGLLNQQAPDLTMTGIDGKKISISNFKGKYLLVDFWASWCAPCRQENPNVVAAYNKFKNKNFTILGVSLDDDKAAWQKAVADDKLTWAHMSDLQPSSEAGAVYQFNGIPFNVLIDPQGKIIAAGLRGQALEQKLSEVLQ